MIWLRQGAGASEVERREGDGGYLASASDLMIGLLFIFIILVVVLALEQRRQEQVLQEQTETFIVAGDPRRFVTDVIGNKLAEALPGAQLDLESGVISLPESVLFDLGSAQLSPSGHEALAQASTLLAQALPCFVASQRKGEYCDEMNQFGHEIETIFIEGHTDNIPLFRAGYDNINLSLDRARSVQRVLVQGTELEEYRNSNGLPLFSLSAYADTRPLAGTKPADPRNRRVDLRVVLAYKPIEDLIPSLRR